MEWKSLRDVLFDNPLIVPESIAIIANDRRVSYGTLRGRVSAVASALARQGIRRGDRVAILLANLPEYVELFFGIAAAGAVVVPLNTRLHPREHGLLLQDCQPRMLIAASAYLPSVLAVTAQVHSVELALLVGEPTAEYGAYEDWLKPVASPDPGAEIGIDEPAAILYTSGTTSSPKGVVLTHRNYLADFAHACAEIKLRPGSVNLQISPLYHAAAVHTLLHLACGGATILNEHFDPETALAQIQSEHVTYLFAVPTILYQLLDHPHFANYDVSSIQLIMFGAAPITGSRLQQALGIFGNKLIHGYGLTETTSLASMLHPAEQLIAPGSIGRGMEGVQLRVTNEKGEEISPGEIGEIIVRGDNVTREYWGRPEDTAKAIRNGWLHTGDLARVDERGFVYIVDRKKDMVISGGVNIYPSEAEEVLAAHPAVAEVAVFGVPDAHWGEALAGAAVLRPGYSTQEQELLEFCRARLGGFKLPKRLHLVEALPKTASGKVQKNVLRQQFETGSALPSNAGGSSDAK